MTSCQGFDSLREQTLREINSIARLYRHIKTGAELLSLINDDENKVFGITFCTLPRDSTGVAHILEHSVLCGSRKYPVKDPFMQLAKGSLNTFLNAFTYPDKTCYPVASQNLQDFYNLIDVYLDAVFHPHITPRILEQEGWHYELERADAPMIYKGVVFNEMKGSYSSPENVLRKLSRGSLFPDSIYGLDSGGDPKNIPELTYGAFRTFHERYYHPSNARIFFYGDDDPAQRLALVDAYLDEFEPIEVDSVTLQPRFDTPRRLERTYAAGKSDHAARNAMVTVNWMLDEVQDAETALALSMLQEILIGTPAAPLRKALIDCGLGSDIAGGGLDDDLRQPMFSTGLKGIDPADADKVEALIFATLGDLAGNGVDPLTVEAALNTVGFNLREYNTGLDARGIIMMVKALKSWLYDRDPLALLAFERPLASINKKIATGERYFEELIDRCLLANNHRTMLVMKPDPEQGERELAEERARLAAARARMSEADLLAIVESTKTLKRLQETPDPPEALATIPMLALADLPSRIKVIPIETVAARDARILYHDLFTNEIIYLDLGFDLHLLPPDLLPFASLFGRALLETGAGSQDFVRLSQRIGRATGGIRPVQWTSTIRNSPAAAAWLCLRAKAMPEQTGDLLDILGDVLLMARLDNRERFHQIVLEEKATWEAALAPQGSAFAMMRLCANFNEADWADEQTGGISYLFFLRKLADQVELDWPSVEAALERIRLILVNRAAMVCNITTDAANWHRFQPRFAAFLDRLPRSPVAPVCWPMTTRPRYEGLSIPAAVNYVAKGADLHGMGYQPTGAAGVIRRYLSTTWLWEKVRVLGGAYGARCSLDHLSGVFMFRSSHDPNLLETLGVFDRTASFLKDVNLDQAELMRGITGMIGEMDKYQLPDAKGFTSMTRHLIGETDEIRQRMRDEVLATTIADFRQFAEPLDYVAESGSVVILGSEQAIQEASSRQQGWLTVTKVL